MSKKYKIEIEVSEDDFNTYANTEEYSDATAKLKKAFEEAKEKEIKIGDWFLFKPTGVIEKWNGQQDLTKGGFTIESSLKLSPKLQQNLNDFMVGVR